MKKIGIIVGTTRENRVSISIATWVLNQIISTNFKYELIDLKEVNLPLLNEPKPAAAHDYKYESTKQWSKLIGSYSGFIIVTGEYNSGYPAVLKNALDHLYTEWHDKAVSFVSYGYSANGTRAIEQLKSITTALKLKNTQHNLAISLANQYKDGQVQSDDKLLNELKQMCLDLETELAK